MSNALETGTSLYSPSHTVTGQKFSPANTRTERLSAIDIVRGLAMIFMLFNHATWHVPGISFRVNFGWDIPLPPLTEYNPLVWFGLMQGTPLFFIMTGFAVSLFEYGRQRKGWSEWQITRFLLIRGSILIAIDWLILPWQFYPQLGYEPNAYYVLTSIGICLWMVAFIRRLPARYIFVIAVVITIGMQAVYKAAVPPTDVDLLRMVFLYMGPLDPVTFGFPVLPWLCVILMGYMTMRYLHTNPEQFARVTLGISIAAWLVWLVINHFRQFGVLFPAHPLLMTKHPPALSYLAFYTGVTYLLLYLLHVFHPVQKRFPFSHIALLGQTALVFYVLHFYAVDIFSALLQNSSLHPFAEVLLITALALALMYVVCTRYRLIRKARPESVLKYL